MDIADTTNYAGLVDMNMPDDVRPVITAMVSRMSLHKLDLVNQLRAIDISVGGGAQLWEVDGSETQLKNANPIDMQVEKIINVVDPTANQDAATKKYVDDNSGAPLWEVDGTESQLIIPDEIDMQTKKIINLVDPTTDQEAATKKYVDDQLPVTHASTTGQTTDDHHAESHAHDGIDGSGTVAHSDTTGIGVSDHHVKYTDGEAVAAVAAADDYLKNDADDTTTGKLTMGDGSTLATSAAPGADAEIANKKYVDDSIPGGNHWDRTGTVLSPVTAGDAVHLENAATKEFEMLKVDGDNLTTFKDNVISVGASKALNFDEDSEVVSIGDQVNLRITGAMTFSAWVKTSVTGTQVPVYKTIFTKGSVTANEPYYIGIRPKNAADTRLVFYWYNGGSIYGAEKISATLDNQAWHHICVTRATGGDAEFWVDGVSIGTDVGNADATDTTSAPVLLGNDDGGGGATVGGFLGDIDEPAIWNVVLSDNDIADLYNGGVGLFIDPSANWPTDGGSQGTNLQGLWHLDEGTGTNAVDDSVNGYDGTLTNMEEEDWVTGHIPATGAAKENTILQSRNGITTGEFGAVELGVDDCRLTLNGKTIRLNIDSVEHIQVDASGDIILLSDNQKIWLGAGQDASLHYDGTDMNIKTDEVAPSDLNIECGAAKTLELQTNVYRDINMAGYLLTRPSSSQPDVVSFLDETGTDTTIETYGFGIGEMVHGGFELQHDYAEGTDLVFHVHWQGIIAPTGTDNVQWRLNYIVMRDGATLDAAVVIDSPDTPFDTQYETVRTDFAAITGTNFKIGDQFMFTLTRVAATGDAYIGDALIATTGIHYEVDTLGSRQLLVK